MVLMMATTKDQPGPRDHLYFYDCHLTYCQQHVTIIGADLACRINRACIPARSTGDGPARINRGRWLPTGKRASHMLQVISWTNRLRCLLSSMVQRLCRCNSDYACLRDDNDCVEHPCSAPLQNFSGFRTIEFSELCKFYTSLLTQFIAS